MQREYARRYNSNESGKEIAQLYKYTSLSNTIRNKERLRNTLVPFYLHGLMAVPIIKQTNKTC